ncbi:hypothetical protein ACFC0C_24905 [Streptomyces sp. NPDC056178]|uniref:hypothetical protein n=1 Tax=unclassified Streptomyces TaxID=2593676 RepID=UPI0035DAD5DD
MKRIASVVGGMVLAAGSLFFTSPSAHAAAQASYGCAGVEIDSYALKYGTVTYGTIHLFYDSSSGKNCAVNVATSAGGYGTPTYKGVWLGRCPAGYKPGASCTDVSDPYVQDPSSSATKYSQYAGPVSVSAAGRCIEVGGSITAPNGTNAHHTTYATHCG